MELLKVAGEKRAMHPDTASMIPGIMAGYQNLELKSDEFANDPEESANDVATALLTDPSLYGTFPEETFVQEIRRVQHPPTRVFSSSSPGRVAGYRSPGVERAHRDQAVDP